MRRSLTSSEGIEADPPARRRTAELRALLAKAEQAIAAVKQDEDAFRSHLAEERARVAEWRKMADRAHEAGSEEGTAEVLRRAAEREAIASELEVARLAVQVAAHQKLDRDLSELRERIR